MGPMSLPPPLTEPTEPKSAEEGVGQRKEAISNCPKKHGLKLFKTLDAGWWCSVCQSEHPKGAAFYGCRECDYDECEQCALIPVAKRGQPKLPPGAWSQCEQIVAGAHPKLPPSSESESRSSSKSASSSVDCHRASKTQKKNQKRVRKAKLATASSKAVVKDDDDVGDSAEPTSEEEPPPRPRTAKLVPTKGTKFVPWKANKDEQADHKSRRSTWRAEKLSTEKSASKRQAILKKHAPERARTKKTREESGSSSEEPPPKRRATNFRTRCGSDPKRSRRHSSSRDLYSESADEEYHDDDDSESALEEKKGASLTKAIGARSRAMSAAASVAKAAAAVPRGSPRPRGGLDGNNILGRVLRANRGSAVQNRHPSANEDEPRAQRQTMRSEPIGTSLADKPRVRNRSLAEAAISELERKSRRV